MSEGTEELQVSQTLETSKPKSRKPLIAGICAAVVVVIAAAIFAAFAIGVLAPPNAAAKYGFFEYITEEECTEYIEIYREQMGYGDGTTDADWATFLAAYNMTPERLRASTIDQLLTDKLVEQKCADLGITVTDDELDTLVENYKNYYASGSDSIWQQTLEAYGQTEEGFRANMKLSLLKEKLTEDQVETPEPTDDEVKAVIANYIDSAVSNEQSLTLKHSYCFKKSKSSSEGSLEEREEVEKIRQGLLDVGASEESFASIIDLYCDDEDLKETSGANGWNADTTGYSDEYIKALDTVGEGGVSSVFADDDCYFFVWVSQTYTLPKKSSKADKIDLDAMPEALHQYFADTAAYSLWQTDAQTYLANITTDIDVIYYDMPADVSYNVDMSLAQTSGEDDSEDTEIGEDAAAAGEDTENADE